MRAWLFILGVASTGCLRKTEYKCVDSAQCGPGGVCEDIGFCSFEDSHCESGRRFGEFSGETYSGHCVGGDVIGDPDAGVDATGDGPMGGGCPGTYAALAGVTGHVYRVVTAAAWQTQMTACAADGSNAYLAIPESQAELTALLTAAAQARIWVGASDTPPDDEMFVTVKNAAFVSTLWDTGEPDGTAFPGSGGGGGADCVAAEMSTGKISDEKCTVAYSAVCECEP